ncbi:MAG TPA: SDR family oxidoreductase [Acidobacteriaceae bacterium]|jgi:glucose 1-dehydrogenase|nr:SDR family oxidoreductase [Acidobacteriaceae bacterium]
MRFKDKVAVVTGAATGIGQAIAIAFAREGASVVVDYVGAPTAAEETMSKISAIGGKAIAVAADVALPSQVDAMVKQTVAEYGRLDILVNNAGIERKFAFVDYPFDEWQKIIAVNLGGAFLCSQAAARQMIAQGHGGCIINISSIHEDLPLLTNSAYCASKGGLRMLMRTIAVELAPHNITVNNIGPGAIYTPIDLDVQNDPKLNEQLMSEIPMRRWGQPEEVAHLALYLASDEASYVTGSTHFIDGGMLRNAGSL